jgi:hypothetical protein
LSEYKFEKIMNIPQRHHDLIGRQDQVEDWVIDLHLEKFEA